MFSHLVSLESPSQEMWYLCACWQQPRTFQIGTHRWQAKASLWGSTRVFSGCAWWIRSKKSVVLAQHHSWILVFKPVPPIQRHRMSHIFFLNPCFVWITICFFKLKRRQIHWSPHHFWEIGCWTPPPFGYVNCYSLILPWIWVLLVQSLRSIISQIFVY